MLDPLSLRRYVKGIFLCDRGLPLLLFLSPLTKCVHACVFVCVWVTMFGEGAYTLHLSPLISVFQSYSLRTCPN